MRRLVLLLACVSALPAQTKQTEWRDSGRVRASAGRPSEFRLVRSDDRGLWFDGISMLRNGNDGMLATVAIKSKDGKVTEGRFEYKRVGSLQPIRR